MSVEKLDFSYVRQEKKSFTTYLNDVIQNVRDGFVLAVYVYLASLPPEWKVNKKHLMLHFGVGRDKISSALAWLRRHKLLEYERERNPDGTLAAVGIAVKDGQDFIEKVLNKQLLNTTHPETRVVVTTVLKNQALVKPDSGKSEPIKYIYNKKEIKKREKQKLRAEKKRAPLSQDFKIDEDNQKLLQEASKKSGRSENDLMLKFKAHMKNKDIAKKYWREKLTIFLINERPIMKLENVCKTIKQEEPSRYGNMRDFTQERLDREAIIAVNNKRIN
jgi:hypothetical protein